MYARIAANIRSGLRAEQKKAMEFRKKHQDALDRAVAAETRVEELLKQLAAESNSAEEARRRLEQQCYDLAQETEVETCFES